MDSDIYTYGKLLDLIEEIEGMKRDVDKYDNMRGLDEGEYGKDIGFNRALDAVISKLKGKL